MLCSGGHLGFLIDTKNINLLEHQPRIFCSHRYILYWIFTAEAAILHIKYKLYINMHWVVPNKMLNFCLGWICKMTAATVKIQYRIYLWEKIFLSETTELFDRKLGCNHWACCFFCVLLTNKKHKLFRRSSNGYSYQIWFNHPSGFREKIKNRHHPFWHIWTSCFFCVLPINKIKTYIFKIHFFKDHLMNIPTKFEED